ncbi:MAG: SOS response-associated peptidase [Hyphomicrobiaceae bacterium]|nr:SOS response-associated peptidase [Hyphomicrobiaceae bacterium]
MTLRYSLTSPPEVVAEAFGLHTIDPFPPRIAVAPTEPVGIVRRTLRGSRELHLVRWGLIPSWMKDPARKAALFTARAETVADKPSFRGGLRHRRCLVPADSFYAWSGETGRRTCHQFRARSGRPMALAGIADHWLGADGSELETMALLTVAANAVVASVTDRMPVILAPGDYDRWLDCRSGEAVSVLELLEPAPDHLLEGLAAGPLPRARMKGSPNEDA